MAKHSTRHTVLSDTATHDNKKGDLRAVIETPKGSRNKYHVFLKVCRGRA
jgi:hypothetical protein